jgi:transcriptional regulator with XRE-family HTH domain
MTAPSMWNRLDMRIALARHDVGAVFRLMQRFGFSQRAIAALTGITQVEVSEIVCGRRRIQGYAVLERLVEGLALPRGWAGLAFDDQTAALRGAAVEDGAGMLDLSRPTARYSKGSQDCASPSSQAPDDLNRHSPRVAHHPEARSTERASVRRLDEEARVSDSSQTLVHSTRA